MTRDLDATGVPACQPDRCGECAPHDPHLTGDCDAALYDRDDQPTKCRCQGGET